MNPTRRLNRATRIAALIVLASTAAAVWMETRRAPALFPKGMLLLDDPDDYLHLHRAREIYEGRTLRVRHMPEIAHPEGTELHWTWPTDALLAAAAILFKPLASGKDPLAAVGVAVPVALGCIYLLLYAFCVGRALGPAAAVAAALLIALTPAWHRPFQLGHPDHHCLLELALLAAFSPFLAARRDNPIPSRAATLFGGLCMGLALWVLAQALLFWAVILIGLTLAAYRDEPQRRPVWLARRHLWNAAALAVALVGTAVENYPDLARLTADKISLFHLPILAFAFFLPPFIANTAITGPDRSISSTPHSARPAGLAARRSRGAFFLTTLALFAYLAIAAPAALTSLHPAEFRRWINLLMEFRPLIVHYPGHWSLAPMHTLLGYVPYALPLLWLFFIRGRDLPSAPRFTIALLAPLLCALTLYQRRWLDHYNLAMIPFLIVSMTALARRLLPVASRVAQPPSAVGPARALPRALIVAVSLFLLNLPNLRRELSPISPNPNPDVLRTHLIADRIAIYERSHPLPDHNLGILCDEAQGPQLLYLTRLPVVAASQHRAMTGLLAAAKFYVERDPAAARRMIDGLRVRYVAVPFRSHEQLLNFEELLYGQRRSFGPSEYSFSPFGEINEKLNYKPEAAQTTAYRLTMLDARGIPGLQPILKMNEGAPTPDGYTSALYAVLPTNSLTHSP